MHESNENDNSKTVWQAFATNVLKYYKTVFSNVTEDTRSHPVLCYVTNHYTLPP